MALFLVQHGRSLPKEKDPDQGLTEEGMAEVKRIAGVAAGYKVRVSRIKHSGKKRAKQTAEALASALAPEGGVEESRGLSPMDDVSAVARELRTEDNLMFVGHLPFMEKLTSYLITGSPDSLIFKFQNGGIVCLDKTAESPLWFIKWALMPNIG